MTFGVVTQYLNIIIGKCYTTLYSTSLYYVQSKNEEIASLVSISSLSLLHFFSVQWFCPKCPLDDLCPKCVAVLPGAAVLAAV